jgi:hypothetical protein
MYYTVTYKKLNSLFKTTLTNVKGDGFVERKVSIGEDGIKIIEFLPIRWFVLDDETRIEVSSENTIFTFSKERWMDEKKQMEVESGQPIVTK